MAKPEVRTEPRGDDFSLGAGKRLRRMPAEPTISGRPESEIRGGGSIWARKRLKVSSCHRLPLAVSPEF